MPILVLVINLVPRELGTSWGAPPPRPGKSALGRGYKTIPTHWEWCHVFLSLRCCWWVWHSTCQQWFLTECRVCLLILVNKDAVVMSPLLGNLSIPRHSYHSINENKVELILTVRSSVPPSKIYWIYYSKVESVGCCIFLCIPACIWYAVNCEISASSVFLIWFKCLPRNFFLPNGFQLGTQKWPIKIGLLRL